jgi:hypothetical protein
MNPILFYPQSAADAIFLQHAAESKGIERVQISKEQWEEIDDMLFAKRMIAAETGRLVSEEKMQALFERKLGRK